MAIITKGKHKSKEVRIHQFCNDWFHVDHPDIPNREAIISPQNLYFDNSEVERIKKAVDAGKTGNMFNFYYWDTPNTLRKV